MLPRSGHPYDSARPLLRSTMVPLALPCHMPSLSGGNPAEGGGAGAGEGVGEGLAGVTLVAPPQAVTRQINRAVQRSAPDGLMRDIWPPAATAVQTEYLNR